MHICRAKGEGKKKKKQKQKRETSFSWNPTKRGQPRQTLMSLIGGAPFLPRRFHRFLNEEKSQTCIPSIRRKQGRAAAAAAALNPYKSTRFHCMTKQPAVSRIQSTIYRRVFPRGCSLHIAMRAIVGFHSFTGQDLPSEGLVP